MNKVRIGGIDYQVEIVPDLRDGDKKLDGWIKYRDCMILIDQSLSRQMARQTLLHEIIHGMITTIGRDIDEDTVDALAYMLLQVIRDNPELWKDGTP